LKIVIGCLNSKYIHASLAPWCLLSGVRAFCNTSVNARVIEATINSDINAFAEQIINVLKYKNVCPIFCLQNFLI
jgi:hypothetical protein